MDHRKRLYETTFIVNASLDDSQIEGVITHVQEIVTRNGGEITAINKWGRKRLAYTIQKKNNGFYVNLEFVGTGPVITQLQRSFLLDQNFLRFLIVQVDPRAVKARQQAAAAVPAAIPAPEAIAAPPAAEPTAPPPAAPVPQRKPLFFDDEAGPPPAPKAR